MLHLSSQTDSACDSWRSSLFWFRCFNGSLPGSSWAADSASSHMYWWCFRLAIFTAVSPIKDASSLWFCCMLHTNCQKKTNVLPLFEKKQKKTHPIDFSDWPLHIHGLHPFEPVQSVLVERSFSIPEPLPFFHWLLMFDNAGKKSIFAPCERMCRFPSRPRLTSLSAQPSPGFLTSVAAPDVAALWLSP